MQQMTWPALVQQMRQLGWNVEISVGMIYVTTPDGMDIGFNRHPKGLQLANRFYERHSQPAPTTPMAPLQTVTASRGIPRARRVVYTTKRRMAASFVILGCFTVIVLAIMLGLSRPAYGLACLIVMLVALLIVMCIARRVL